METFAIGELVSSIPPRSSLAHSGCIDYEPCALRLVSPFVLIYMVHLCLDYL